MTRTAPRHPHVRRSRKQAVQQAVQRVHGPPRQRRRDRPLSVSDARPLGPLARSARCVPGDGIGPEVVAEGLKVLDAVAGAAGRQGRDDRVRPRRPPLARAPARPCPTRCSRSCAATTRSCSAPSATRRVPSRACSSAACCCGCASRSTTTSTCARSGSTPASPTPLAGARPRHRLRRRPRGHRGPVRRQRRRRCATGTPHEIATEVSVNTAYGVERVVRDAFGRAQAPPAQAPHPGAQDQRARPRRRPLGAHRRRRSAQEFPDVDDRLPARRRRDDLPRHRARSGSTSSSPTTCSATSSPTSAPPSPAASGSPRAATSTSSRHQPDACSSRCTARRPDIAGQGKADPTATILSVAHAARPPRPRRRGRARSRRPSPPTSPSAARRHARGDIGDALGDAVLAPADAVRRPSGRRARPRGTVGS